MIIIVHTIRGIIGIQIFILEDVVKIVTYAIQL